MRRKVRFSWLVVLVLVLVVFAAACQPAAEPVAEEPMPTPTLEEAEPEPEPTEEALAMAHQLVVGDSDDRDRVRALTFAPDGETLLAGGGVSVFLYDVAAGSETGRISFDLAVEDVAISPDGAWIAAGKNPGGVEIAPPDDAEARMRIHSGYNNRVAFSRDGETLATGNRSGLVWLWSMPDGEQIAELDAPDDEFLTALAYSLDGQVLAVSYNDCTARLFRVSDGSLQHTLERGGINCQARGLAFTPDGETLATVGVRVEREDGVGLWRVADGSLITHLTASGRAYDVAISPDGTLLAAGSQQGVTVWSLPDGELLYQLGLEERDETQWVTTVAFSPDGTLLAAGRWDGFVDLWRIAP